MGIKFLNRVLREKCTSKSIYKQHLSNFTGKRMVIDTSIYLYQFLSDDTLMENMYLFISILQKYKIEPIFIFDGKTPIDKKQLVKERSQNKKEAEDKYNKLLELKNKKGNEDEINIDTQLKHLKQQFTRVSKEDIRKVKELMDAYGVIYYDAPYEADDLCVYFVKSGIAYGCISDDMDMLLYGCPFVLRNLSLINHSVLFYDMDKILKELDIPFNHFQEILVLSGTDYNITRDTDLIQTLRWYNEYLIYVNKNKNNKKKHYGFYLWLIKNTKYITDLTQLMNTYQLFNNKEKSCIRSEFNKQPNNKDMLKIKNIMKKEGFVFCEPLLD